MLFIVPGAHTYITYTLASFLLNFVLVWCSPVCCRLMNYGGRPVPLVDLFSLMLKYTKEKVAVEEDDHNGVEVLQTKLQQWRAAEEMKLEGEPY